MQRYVYWYRFEKNGDETFLRFPKFLGIVSSIPTVEYDRMSQAERLDHVSDAILTELQTIIATKAEVPAGDDGLKSADYGVVSLSIVQSIKLELFKIYRSEFRSVSEFARHLGKMETSVRRMLDIYHRSSVSEIEDTIEALGRRIVLSWDSELIGPNRHTAQPQRQRNTLVAAQSAPAPAEADA